MPRKDSTGPQGMGAGSGRRHGECCVAQRGKHNRRFDGQADMNSGQGPAGQSPEWNQTQNQARNQARNSGHGHCRRNRG